jgi:type II secretion system protein I
MIYLHSKKEAGFTLIEVLVALVIIAIACFAVLRIVSSSISMEKRLENHVVGTWVSQNVLTDLRAGAVTFDAATNDASGSTKILYQSWPWQARLIQQDGFVGHYDQSVGIVVKDALASHKTIWRLQGYVPLKGVPHA